MLPSSQLYYSNCIGHHHSCSVFVLLIRGATAEVHNFQTYVYRVVRDSILAYGLSNSFYCSYNKNTHAQKRILLLSENIPGYHETAAFRHLQRLVSLTRQALSTFLCGGGGGLTRLTDLPSAETESYFNSECLKPCWKRYFLQYASRTRMAHANAQTLSPPASLPRGSFWLVHLSCQSEPCGRDSNNPLVFPSLWTPQQTKSGADSSKATAFILLPEDNSSWFLRFSVPVQRTGN